jgi:hypothetical protein
VPTCSPHDTSTQQPPRIAAHNGDRVMCVTHLHTHLHTYCGWRCRGTRHNTAVFEYYLGGAQQQPFVVVCSKLAWNFCSNKYLEGLQTSSSRISVRPQPGSVEKPPCLGGVVGRKQGGVVGRKQGGMVGRAEGNVLPPPPPPPRRPYKMCAHRSLHFLLVAASLPLLTACVSGPKG